MKVLNQCTEENPSIVKILEMRIQLQFYERILQGTKKWEIRRHLPGVLPPVVKYIDPDSKCLGYHRILSDQPVTLSIDIDTSALVRAVCQLGDITQDNYEQLFSGSERLYAMPIDSTNHFFKIRNDGNKRWDAHVL